jgi:hypothetical protein
MTIMTIGSATDVGVEAGGSFAAAAAPLDHPGRWLGGLAGACSALVAAVLLFALERPLPEEAPSLVGGPMAMVALLGIPIAFALGRAAFPSIRSGGWRWAIVAGVLIGLAAPPLGAFEILFGPFLLPIDPTTSDQFLLIAFLPIALVFSYLVVWITIPVGLLTALAVRALPAGLPARLRAPEGLARFGVRHAILAAGVWGVLVQAVTAIGRG